MTSRDESAAGTAGEARRPHLRVVRGDPTPEELAALTVVLAARTAAPAADQPSPSRARWRDRAPLLRRPIHPGPDAWRTSALPR